MLGAIKRVISGGSMVEKAEEASPAAPAQHPNTSSTPDQSNTPALVEHDQDVTMKDASVQDTEVHVTHIGNMVPGTLTPRSSLSDVSAADEEDVPNTNNHNQSSSSSNNSSNPDASASSPQNDSRVDSAAGHQLQADPRQQMHARPQFPRNDSKNSNDGSSGAFSFGSMRASSQNSSRDWGWFEDVHQSASDTPYLKRKDTADKSDGKKKGKKQEGGLVPVTGGGHSGASLREMVSSMDNSEAAAMAVTAPNYVLEESLSSQKLWKVSAGTRPPQPVEERAFFEKMWAQNFERSKVEYQVPVEVLTAASPISMSPFADGNFDDNRANDLSSYNVDSAASKNSNNVAEATLMSRLTDPSGHDYNEQYMDPTHLQQAMVVNKTIKGSHSDGNLTVLIKGDNVFGTTVSKSFARPSENGVHAGVDTINISIASYRVVESKKHGKYAQFLVIYREGSIRDTIGVWKRYSDFEELSKKVTQAHEGCASVIANMSPLAVAEEHEVEHLPNAITSWRLLKKRQRWYRCLDAGYLSLKVFLLERFLHDILFESTSPNLLRDFVRSDQR